MILRAKRALQPHLRRRSQGTEFLAVVLSLGAATAARWLLDPTLGPQLPFAFHLLAIAFMAWFARLTTSLIALIAGAWLAEYLFVAPRFSASLSMQDAVRQAELALYLCVGGAVIAVSEMSRRARTAAEIRRQELEITLASIGDAVIATDDEGRVQSLNGVAESLTGWKQTEARGRALEEVFRIVNEETRATVENPVAKVLELGTTVGLGNHTVLIARDGTDRPIDDSAAPIQDPDGSVLGVVLIFRDITERRRFERERFRLAAIVDSSDDAILAKDRNGIITSWNRGAERLYGYTAAEVVGQSITTIIPEDRRDELRTIMAKLNRGERIEHHETVRLRKNGERIDVSVTISPILDNEGNVVGGSSIAREIGERKRTEEHTKFLGRASELFASSLDFDTTMRNIAQLAVPTLADWVAVDIASRESDQPYRRLAVAHVDPAKTELAMELRRKYPPDPATDRVLKAIQSGEPELVTDVPDEILREASRDQEHYEILKSIGITSWMIVPLRMRDVSIGAVTFVSSDSKRRFTESDLHHAQEFARRASIAFENSRLYSEAHQANRAKDNFLATLSHELRTPMTAIVGWAQMLANGNLDRETHRIAVEAIERSARVQVELIEDVLDMSRIASGKMRLDVQMTDLAEIARAALATIEPAAAAKGIRLSLQVVEPLIVTADPKRLQQVIWNLLTNGVKFTPKGGHVQLRLEEADSMAQVTVTDNGQGFPREFGAHLFEPFRQAESATTRTHGGLGLGLSIVRYLVEQHGGTVTAESQGAGQGATFRVRIPLRAVKNEEHDHSPSPLRLAREGHETGVPCHENQLQNVCVLFVDDQEDARVLFRTILRRCGAEVSVAASVDEAKEKFQRGRFDLVATDIAMPRHDGFELIKWLNGQPNRSDFRVVALTAFGGADDRQRVLQAGCDDYLKKPIEAADLIAAVERLTGFNPELAGESCDSE